MVNRSLKIRLYPNKTITQKLLQNIGSCRFLYNQMLAERKEVYTQFKDNKRELYEYTYKTEKQYKEEYLWMAEADSTSLQQSRRDLETAYSNFFKRLRKGIKGTEVGFPKFHKRGQKDSFRIQKVSGNIKIDFERHKLKLPKMDWITYRDSRIPKIDKIINVTISRTKTGKFFASICYEVDFAIPKPKHLKAKDVKVLGLDMSLASFYIDHSNTSPEGFEKWYRRYQEKISALQVIVSRRQKGSRRRAKAQLRVNRVFEVVTNKRLDFQRKLALKLAKEYDVVVIETLNLKDMAQHKSWEERQQNTHNHGKSVYDLGWFQFTQLLKQKALEQGCEVIEASQWFASSKTCNVCGYVKKDLQLLEREWLCPKCQTNHFRDQNAALNLQDLGIKSLAGRQVVPDTQLIAKSA